MPETELMVSMVLDSTVLKTHYQELSGSTQKFSNKSQKLLLQVRAGLGHMGSVGTPTPPCHTHTQSLWAAASPSFGWHRLS